jgi:hypothetical protein
MFKKYLCVLLVVLCTSCGKANFERLVGSWECQKSYNSTGQTYNVILSSVGELSLTFSFNRSIKAGALQVTAIMSGNWAVSNNGYLEYKGTGVVWKKATINGNEKHMGQDVVKIMNKEIANNPGFVDSLGLVGSYKLDILSDNRFNYEDNGTYRCSRS